MKLEAPVKVSRSLSCTWRILSRKGVIPSPPGSLTRNSSVLFGRTCKHSTWEEMGFFASSLPDFLCRVSVSASPARSPVFSHLTSSLQGLWTIRAYKAEQRFQELFDSHQDLHSGLWVSGVDFRGWDVLSSEAWPPSQVVLLARTSLCAAPCPPLHRCLPHPILSAPHLCSPPFSSPQTDFHHSVLWLSVPLGQESIYFLLLLKQQIANILDFVCHSISVVIYQLCCFSPKKAKVIHQQKHMTVFQ